MPHTAPSLPYKCSGLHCPGKSCNTSVFQGHSELSPQTWLTQTAELGPVRTINLEYLWSRVELTHRDCLSLVVSDTSWSLDSSLALEELELGTLLEYQCLAVENRLH